MSDTENPVKIEIGASAKVSVDVKMEIPPESSGRLVDALTELIRPFSVSRGLKADRLQLEREEVLYEIAVRARKRLEIQNAPIRPLSNKFLVPLLEKASLEDLSDRKLIDMWANLLATALTQDVELLGQYVGILSEITGGQARIFEDIVLRSLPRGQEIAKTGHFIDQYYYLNHTGLPGSLSHLTKCKSATTFAKRLYKGVNGLGVAIDTISVYDNTDKSVDFSISNYDDSTYNDDLFFDFENLCRMGLLDHVEIKNMLLGQFSFDVFYYIVTPVGIDLYACCNPAKIQRDL